MEPPFQNPDAPQANRLSFLDDSNESGARRWLHGSLPRQLLRRAKLTETTMRLAVLGLTADAERFTELNVNSTRCGDVTSHVCSDGHGARTCRVWHLGLPPFEYGFTRRRRD